MMADTENSSNSNGLVVEGDTQLRKRAWKDKFREQLLQTPSKRRRRLLVEELLLLNTTTTTGERSRNDADFLHQNNNHMNDLPALDYSWSEDELLEWLKELEHDWEQEQEDALLVEAAYHAHEEEQDISKRVEDYESSLEQMETEDAMLVCPLCLDGVLLHQSGKDDRTVIACTQCSMQLETEMSMNELRDKLRDAIDLHAEFCSRPVEMKLAGEMLLVATCDVCETRLSII